MRAGFPGVLCLVTALLSASCGGQGPSQPGEAEVTPDAGDRTPVAIPQRDDARPVHNATFAIIPGAGKRSASDAAVAKLEVSLSDMAGVDLVERALVRRVLAEHTLSASGLVDPSTAITVGNLVSADALLFVEAVPKSKPATLLLHMIESRTGIVLASAPVSGSLARDGDAGLRLFIRSAREKLGVPPTERRYLALMGIRNEEPGGALEPTAVSLGMLVESQLSTQNGIVLLDRAHVVRLREEKALTGLEQNIRASAVVVEGGVRRAGNAGGMHVTLKVCSLSGGTERLVVLENVGSDPERARTAVTRTILDAVGGKLLGAGVRRSDEARLFAARVPQLLSTWDYEGATAAAEAAYALERNRITAFWTAKAWCDAGDAALKRIETAAKSNKNLEHEYGTKWRGNRTIVYSRYKNTPRAELAEAFAMMVRGREVAIDFCRFHMDAYEAKAVRDAAPVMRIGTRTWDRLHAVWRTMGSIDLAPGEADLRALRQRVARLDVERFRLMLAFFAKHAPETEDEYWDTWNTLLLDRTYPDQPDEQTKLIEEAADAFARPPFRHSSDGVSHERIGMMAMVPLGLDRMPVAQRQIYVKAFRRLQGHRDPYVRLCAGYGLVNLVHEPLASACSALDVFVEEIPLTHAYRKHYRFERCTAIVVFSLLEVLAEKDRDAYHAYCRQIFLPLVADEDGRRMNEWVRQMAFRHWVEALTKDGRIDEAARVVDGAFALVTNSRVAVPHAAGTSRWLREERDKLLTTLGRRDDSGSAWRDYDITPVAYRPSGAGGILGGRTVYEVKRVTKRAVPDRFDVAVVVRRFPDGGEQREIGRVSSARRIGIGGVYDIAVHDAVVCGDSVYVGTGSGLCVFPVAGGEATILTDRDGMPGKGVLSLAEYGGQLYAGFSGGFARFDPATATWSLIASSRAIARRSPLDGGDGYAVYALLADRRRSCLWLGVSCKRRTRDRSGVWRYDLTDGKLSLAVDLQRESPYDLYWTHRGIMAILSACTSALVDPDRLRWTWLAALNRRRDAEFGMPGVAVGDAVLDGDRMITGGYRLYLHQAGQPPQIVPSLPDGTALRRIRVCTETEFGIFVYGTGGSFLINRKGAGRPRTVQPRYVDFDGSFIR